MGIISEIVPHAEAVGQLVGQSLPGEIAPHQGDAALSPAPGRRSEQGSVDPVGAVVDHDDGDGPGQIEGPSCLIDRRPGAADVVIVGPPPVYAVNHRLPLVVGLQPDGPVAVSVSLHLLAEPSLGPEHLLPDPLNDLGAIGAVIRQEVEHPHRARFAGLQVRQALARGVGDGRRLSGLEEQAGMQAVRGRRGSVADGRGREEENDQESVHGNRFHEPP